MRNCLTVVLMLIVFGCSAAADDSAGSGGNTATGTGLNGGLGGGAGSGQFLPDGGTADAAPPAVAHLEGTVYAPEGTIPISGALVYATQQTPEPIPQKVFCDRCIKLEFDTPYTLSDVDGSFSLGIPSTGSWLLVVQKGAFRRVRSVEVATGKQAVDAAMSTLPGKSDPAAGDDIPRIAVAEGDFDAVENTLAKLGLGQVDAEGELLAGSESFDLITAPVFGWPPPPDERIELLTNYDKLSQYHIVMFPCAGEWPDGYLKLPEVSANLRKFVESGGRIYASDYSYDILRQSWPEPLSWKGDNGKLGSAETAVGFTTPPPRLTMSI